MSARRLIWGVLLSVFFASTLVLSWPLGRGWFVSPDEHAAFAFAQAFAHTGKLSIPEPLNETLGGLLHPRSAIGFGNAVVPASFIGFVVFLGLLAAVFGNSAMYLVTPILAVLAVILWRESVRRVFKNAWLADAAAFLLMVHPAFWYYTGRVMMHNVAFLTLLIAGLWWCLAQPLAAQVILKRRPWVRLVDFTIAGMLFGSALGVRTSEIFWVTFVIAAACVVYRKLLGWQAVASLALGFAVMLGALALLNNAVYGGPLTNGYTAQYPYAAVVISDEASSEGVSAEPHRNLFLPFGFHERVILHNVIDYGWRLYPWMSVLAVIGMILAVAEPNPERRLWRGLVLMTGLLAAWLGVVYGSWKIIDNPDPSIISLGNSHVRYWLPLFALASVFAARTLVYLLGDKAWWRRVLVGAMLLLITLLSGQLVFFGQDGFIPSRQAVSTFVAKHDDILTETEANSIIIVDRADKYLFPDRRVVVPLRDDKTYAAIPAMLNEAPVYYFGITLPPQDIAYLNTQKLPPLHVQIEFVQTMNEESLYRFVND